MEPAAKIKRDANKKKSSHGFSTEMLTLEILLHIIFDGVRV